MACAALNIESGGRSSDPAAWEASSAAKSLKTTKATTTAAPQSLAGLGSKQPGKWLQLAAQLEAQQLSAMKNSCRYLKVVPEVGLEPTSLAAGDFESPASTIPPLGH
jgi:hypothetical protein